MRKEELLDLLTKIESNNGDSYDIEEKKFVAGFISLIEDKRYESVKEVIAESSKRANLSRLFYNYLTIDDVNQSKNLSIILRLCSNLGTDNKIKETFVKVLFELLAFYLSYKNVDTIFVARFFCSLLEGIKSVKEVKGKYLFFADSFLPNISETADFCDFSDSALPFVPWELNLIIKMLDYVKKMYVDKIEKEIEKNPSFLPDDCKVKFEVFKLWLTNNRDKMRDKKDLSAEILVEVDEYEELKNRLKDNDKLFKKFNDDIEDRKKEIEILKRQIDELRYEKRKLNEELGQKEMEIDNLNESLADQKQLTSIVEKDSSHKNDENLKSLANKLNYDYMTFQEAKDEEMCNELGELLREQLKNVFCILKNFGLKLE